MNMEGGTGFIFHQRIESREDRKGLSSELPPVRYFLQEGSPPKGSLTPQTASSGETKSSSTRTCGGQFLLKLTSLA